MIYRRRLVDRGRWRVGYERRTRDEPMGRFGGGWQFNVGFESSRSCVILNLGVAMLRVSWREPCREQAPNAFGPGVWCNQVRGHHGPHTSRHGTVWLRDG